ncbi:ExeM/NucH family extracellular endonuclease [Rubrivirga sp. S365]|uniref:ExeM/NucH family extracellular endonuclease n=1 Tax=Rubrivirga sp. S365 TaxID=3076080 RepID=UPI0028C891EA|nr:ExeM/NucH family extracellular endonuclease [Rubrivirga sp. S365]MDT7856420.1 ExeM/NucH family extracellular endonuclease [Rubrivirga sp. S365]
MRLAPLARLLLLAGTLGLGSAQAQAVFINEIHYDNASTDVGETIEVAGPAGTNLAGWTLVLYNGSNSSAYSTTVVGGAIPNERDGAGVVAVEYGSNGIQNGAPDAIALVDADGAVVQFLSYEGTLTAADGPAAGLTSTDIGVSEAPSTPIGESLQLIGTGSTYGDFAWVGPTASSFGSLNEGQVLLGGDGPPPPSGEPRLVVNEVDYDQPGTDAAEYVELFNGGAAAASLGAYELVLVNGNDGGAAVYKTIGLPATDLLPGEFFVVCANAETVANCDLDVDPSTNLIQNGAPDAVALRLAGGGAVVDALSYEGSVPGFTEGSGAGTDPGDADFVALSRLPDGADTDDNAADFAPRCGSPGAANAEDATNCPSTAPGAILLTFIHDVQGSGAATPLDGRTVTVEAVVVGDFQPDDGDAFDLGGFYLQEEDADADSDPATSEGLFVFTGDASVPVPDVSAGDVVRVTGTAGEFFELTQVGSVTEVAVVGTAAQPTPAAVTLPLAGGAALERFEGMGAVLPQELAISDYFNFDRFGEVVLALPRDGRDRLFQPTAFLDPGPEAAEVDAENALRVITLDDGRAIQNADVPRHPNGQPFTLTNRFRGGDIVQDAAGVIDFRFGLYRLQPTAPAGFTVTNPRPEQPESVGGAVRVASFNVLNYFNGDGQGGGFPTSRGADNPEELARQTAKIVAAIRGLDAAVVGVIEVENDEAGELSALDDLVDALNAAEGGEAYAYVETGVTGTDFIRSGIVYRPARVTPIGDVAVLDDPAFTKPPGGSENQKNRPVVAQTFTDADGVFTVAVVHLRSKGGSCGAGNDDPLQGACNGTRTVAARELARWLAGDPTGSGDADVLIVGDFNAYDEEDPIDALRAGADGELGTADDYVDLVERAQGEFAYSYLFGAEFGTLDYAFASLPLAEQVTGATVWHINADEPDLLDYDTDFNDPRFYEPTPFRASDHDPVLVGLALGGGAQAAACSASSPLGFGDFDADGTDPAFGEFAELLSGADGPVDLSTCSFVTFDPFTETVTYSASPDAVIGDRLVYATQNGDVGLPAGVIPDGPGAIALVEGAAPVGTPVAGVLGRVVSAVVYVSEDQVFGRTGYSSNARTAGGDLAALLAAVRADLPAEVELTLAGANPVGTGGAVAFALPEGGAVTVSVFDLLGREVSRLVDATLAPGRHRAALDAGALPSGVYVVRLVAGGEVRTQRVTVAR